MLLNVVVIAGIFATFLPMELPVQDDTLVVIGSSPRPGCGHIEHKSDAATVTRHIIEIYDCSGRMSNSFDVELVDLHVNWNVLHRQPENFAVFPLVVGLQTRFSIAYITNEPAHDLRTAFFTYSGLLLSNEVEHAEVSHPAATLLADGTMALMFHDTNYHLYLSIYESNGIKTVDNEKIADFGNHGKISGYIDGGWVAVFEGNGCGCSLVVSQPAEGTPFEFNLTRDWTPEESKTRIGSYYPTVKAFSDRMGFVASWCRNGTNYLRTFDEKGNPLSEEVVLVHPDNKDDVNSFSTAILPLQLGYDGQRGHLLTWSEEGNFTGSLAQEIYPNGTLGSLKSFESSGYFPFGYITSAGYGLDFYSTMLKNRYPTRWMFATCNQSLDHTVCGDGETYFPENICNVFPCDPATCCSKQTLSVKHNDVGITPVFVKVSSGTVQSNGLSLQHVQGVYATMDVFVPKSLAKGSRIRLECGSEQVVCTFILVVYSCTPCSEGVDGGFPVSLPKSGWVEVGGAPQFKLGEASNGYPMKAFKIYLPTNQTFGRQAEITASCEGPYVAIFGKQGMVNAPAPTQPSDSDCSFPTVLSEMVGFMTNYSNFSKLGS